MRHRPKVEKMEQNKITKEKNNEWNAEWKTYVCKHQLLCAKCIIDAINADLVHLCVRSVFCPIPLARGAHSFDVGWACAQWSMDFQACCIWSCEWQICTLNNLPLDFSWNWRFWFQVAAGGASNMPFYVSSAVNEHTTKQKTNDANSAYVGIHLKCKFGIFVPHMGLCIHPSVVHLFLILFAFLPSINLIQIDASKSNTIFA